MLMVTRRCGGRHSLGKQRRLWNLWSPRAGSGAGHLPRRAVPGAPAGRAARSCWPSRAWSRSGRADADFRDTRGARLRAAAENLAGTSAVRSGLTEGSVRRSRWRSTSSGTQTVYSASAVYLARPDGTVVVAADPTAGGDRGRPRRQRRPGAAGPGPATSTTAAAGRSPPRCRSSATDRRELSRRSRWSRRPTPRWRDRRPQRPAGPRRVPRRSACARRRRLVAAGAADQAPYPRAGARRDRRARRPARGAAALDPRGRGGRRRRRAGHRDQRQRPRAARAAVRRARAAGWPSSACAAPVRDLLGGRRRRARRGAGGRRPGAWCSTATGSLHEGRQVGTVTTLRDRTELLAHAERAERPRERHRDAAGADPRVQQPAAHHLRAAPARGVRRGCRGDRHR